MATIKTIIAENIQEHLDKLDWQAAIAEMEKYFAFDRDPLIRVRIGDIRSKLNKSGPPFDNIRAADLFVERGFGVKALAQYNLALRLDSSNDYARSKIEMLRKYRSFRNLRREPAEYQVPKPLEIMPEIFIIYNAFEITYGSIRMVLMSASRNRP